MAQGRAGERDEPRGYHHGNLREALIRAALELIAKKGAAGFTFADAARSPGSARRRRYRHFRDRDELLSNIALRGFEQFEAALSRAWDDGRPDTVAALERVGKAYLEFARTKPAFYSAMFEAGLPVDADPALRAASDRAFAVLRGAADKLCAAMPAAAPAGLDDGAAYLVHVARCGLVVRTWRCGAQRAADVGGGTAGGARADLSARSRRPSATDVGPLAVAAMRKTASMGLDKETALDVNVHYIHLRGCAMAIVLMVLGFIWWWPLGLIILGFLIARRKYGYWRQPMFAGNEPMYYGDRGLDRWERKIARLQEKMEHVRGRMERFRSRGDWFGPSSSGNRAFDDYRAETLKRLEDEQREFKEFLERLRFAKDRSEFDQFMAARRDRPFEPGSPSEPPPAEPDN